MKRILLATASVSLFLGAVFASPAHAQEAGGNGGDVTYKQKTVYDFDDDVVEGDLQKPEGEFLDVKKKSKHSSLIKIRQNFIDEMLKSAEDI